MVGSLVYLNEKLDADSIRPARIAEVIAYLEDDGVIVQPLDPLTCKPEGSEETIPDDGCREIHDEHGQPATKEAWLAAPWPETK